MISIQTNYAAMVGTDNLQTTNNFQTSTVEALTSGYRINNSGDDPAGLAVANQYRDNISELTQGVINANNGVSTLQIMDGGLNNISTMLDRLKTLATESASTTFTGNRASINVEYQQLVSQITQQATNIGLNSGGTNNVNNVVYIGGGSDSANSEVQVDLSGTANAVDSTSLGLANTTVVGGGSELTGSTVRLDAPGVTFLNAANQSTAFSFNLISNGNAVVVPVTVTGAVGGLTEAQVLNQLNSTLNPYGINAQVGSDGQLQFSGGTPFTVTATNNAAAIAARDGVAGTAAYAPVSASNGGTYNVQGAGTYAGGLANSVAETLTFQNGSSTATVNLAGTETLGGAIAAINSQTSALGIYAVSDAGGTGISFQSTANFTVSTTGTGGVFTNAGAQAVTAPAGSGTATGNAASAITAINGALLQLGQAQAAVGAGENKLQYAINLANSQITNFSSAESQIRDADVATEAANLSKAQVLEQASVAAMAQANSAPQALLKLLQ
ncbi:MAG: flagellin [Bryobacteraceae bacterium]|jgi:flagellin